MNIYERFFLYSGIILISAGLILNYSGFSTEIYFPLTLAGIFMKSVFLSVFLVSRSLFPGREIFILFIALVTILIAKVLLKNEIISSSYPLFIGFAVLLKILFVYIFIRKNLNLKKEG